MSVNKVIVLGRLGSEPELRYTPSGAAVCNFSVATSDNWTDKNGEKQEKTEWHRIVVWGKLGELCHQYLSKGRQAYIEGKLQTRSWEDNNGVKKYTTEILANTVQFIGSNPTAGTNANAGNNANHTNDNVESFDIPTNQNFAADDIPF